MNKEYQQKSIPLCSPEQNYLSLFAMKYPVVAAFNRIFQVLLHSASKKLQNEIGLMHLTTKNQLSEHFAMVQMQGKKFFIRVLLKI